MDFSNIIWRSLTGSHARFAAGAERIVRYARGFPALIGFADTVNPDFASLARYCETGERLYCGEWRGPAPAGWKIEVDATMCAMGWNGATPAPDVSFPAVRLRPEHVPQMMALAGLTNPGPFAQRPLDLGEWYGAFEGERLVAMAGERMQCGSLREISGVCTLPEYQGRGLAKRLTEVVIRSQLARGLSPFLHVTASNTRAKSLYERMGFVVARETAMRVVSLAEAP